MANTPGMLTSFKKELMCGSHAFGTQAANATRTVTTKDVFYGALIKTSGTIGLTATAFSSLAGDELTASGNYSSGGLAATNTVDPSVAGGTVAYWTPSAVLTWPNLTSAVPFDCLFLYNNTSTGKLGVSIHQFSTQNISGGTFTLTMPNNDGTNGLIRIA